MKKKSKNEPFAIYTVVKSEIYEYKKPKRRKKRPAFSISDKLKTIQKKVRLSEVLNMASSDVICFLPIILILIINKKFDV